MLLNSQYFNWELMIYNNRMIIYVTYKLAPASKENDCRILP